MPRGFHGGFHHGGFRMRGFGFGRPFYPMGFGLGPLLGGLLTGGLGYLLGRSSTQYPDQPGQTYQQPYQESPANGDVLAQLKLLGELHDQGVLTDEEFTREKNRLLGR